MKKIVVPISGMHCKACVLLTEDRLSELKSIDKVRVSLKKEEAEIYYQEDKPSLEEIGLALKEAGYGIEEKGNKNNINENKDGIEKNLKKRDFIYWFTIFASVIIIYWLLNNANLIQVGALSKNGFSAPVALLVGLVAGVSTCLALVGGLILSLSANYAKRHPEATRAQKIKPQILFNTGRVIGFFIFGGLLGLLGSAFKISTLANSIITVFIGLVIIFLGLKLLDVSPKLNKIDFSLPKKFGKVAKINDPLILGALTFFLPCGFTQAMQVYALSTGDFISAATIMTFFAIGTIPGLFGIGSLGSSLNNKKSKNFFVAAGVVVLAFGIFNFHNGYRLFKVATGAGNITTLASKKDNDKNSNEVVDGVQIIRMTQHARGYSPNYFKVKVKQAVKWIIDSQEPYSCASALVVPALNIQTQLKKGENIFEFTPDKTGEIRFSCSMGMYSGKFEVVD